MIITEGSELLGHLVDAEVSAAKVTGSKAIWLKTDV